MPWNLNEAIVILREMATETAIIAVNCGGSPCDAQVSGLSHGSLEEVFWDSGKKENQTLPVINGGSCTVQLDAMCARLFIAH